MRDRTTMTILAAAAVLIASGAWLFARAEMDRRQIAAMDSGTKIAAAPQSSNQYDSMSKIKTELDALERGLSPDVPSGIMLLTNALDAVAVQDRTLKSGESATTGMLRKTPVTISFHGGFEQLLELLQTIESSGQTFRIARLRANDAEQGDGLSVVLQIEFFTKIRKG